MAFVENRGEVGFRRRSGDKGADDVATVLEDRAGDACPRDHNLARI